MGPLADETFVQLLNSCTNGAGDASHISFMLDCNTTRPDRSEFLCQKSFLSPFESLKKSVDMLINCGCDMLAMPCNTAHFWYEELSKDLPTGVDFPSMPSLTAMTASRYSSSAAVLSTEGTRLCGIYSKEFASYGIKELRLPTDISCAASNAIYNIKYGKSIDPSNLLQLCSEHTDTVILGCTELSRAILNSSSPIPHGLTVIDSLSVLARYLGERYFGCSFSLKYT